MSWQIICSKDKTLCAIVHGNYKKDEVPPASAYEIVDGIVGHPLWNKKKPTLFCPNHTGFFTPVWKKVKE